MPRWLDRFGTRPPTATGHPLRAPLSRRALGRLALAALGTALAAGARGAAAAPACQPYEAGIRGTPPAECGLGAVRPRVTLSAPAALQQRTARTSALGPDGYSWAQARNPLVDGYGKIIAFVQSAQSIQPVVSNDRGATWLDPTMTGWQGSEGGAGEVGIRCALAYDGVNDTVHALFVHSNTADAGSYYRRFRVDRDDARNIVGLTRDASINCVLDRQDVGEPASGTAHPVIFWLNDDPAGRPHGYLVCLWGVNEDTGTAVSASVRGTMLVLTNSAADNDVASWRGLRGESTIVATSTQKPQVPCTEIFHRDPGKHHAYQAHPAAIRLPADAPTHGGDLCVLVAVAGEGLHYRRLGWSAATGDWRGEMSALATGPSFARAGTSDVGYAGKQELVPEPSYDAAHDRLWVGLGEWADQLTGDAWSVTYVDNAADAFRAGPPTVVYGAGAARSGADAFVTGDAWWDDATACLLVAYTDLPHHRVYVVALGADEAVVDGPLAIFAPQPFDIPVFLRATWPGGRRMIIGRGFNPEAANTPPSYTGGPYDGWALTFVIS